MLYRLQAIDSRLEAIAIGNKEPRIGRKAFKLILLARSEAAVGGKGATSGRSKALVKIDCVVVYITSFP